MIGLSYLSVIERYHEYREAIRELLASILTGIAEARLFRDVGVQRRAMRELARHYPFVDLLFTLDADGVQRDDNVTRGDAHPGAGEGRGRNRCQRPYYQLARDADRVVVTEPYLSSAGSTLCISAAIKVRDADGETEGYLVLDIDLGKTIAFLMGDTARRRFQPFFRGVFGLIVLGLFAVVGVLLVAAFGQVAPLFAGEVDAAADHGPFGAIIFLTLALALFDLGKTILEEEVLMHKDIFRHSSTRRTITRFIAAILIAVSIEALLLMFKAAVGDGRHLDEAVWMMFAAVGLLVGLGVYVNLGARAEVALLNRRPPGRPG
jgi:hypothetical protein